MHVTFLPYFKYVYVWFDGRLSDMDFFFLSAVADRFRKDRLRALAFLWICGLAFGTLTAAISADGLLHRMYSCLHAPVSIGSLLTVMLIPVAVSAFCVLIRKPFLLFVVSFLKAYSLSYHAFFLCLCFDCAGWILLPLLFFSDLVSSVILWMFWIGSVRFGIRDLSYRVIPALAAVFLACSVDCSLVSPFLGAVLLS